MKITALKQQIKNPLRISVFVEGKYSFSLSLDEIARQKLKTGKDIGESEIKKLKKLSEEEKIKTRTLNWLLTRPHSQKELTDYLRRKNVNDDLAEHITKEFISRGFQSDEQFAKWWVESRLQSKFFSKRKISFELSRKGIDKQLAEACLENINDRQSLQKLVDKKSRQSRYKDPQKLKTYLLRQGYSYDDINQATKYL